MTLPAFTSFSFKSHEVRTIVINGEPWFVAQDVCRALQIQNVTQAIEKLDDDERSMFNIGRQGEANIISESGMFTLVLRCRDAIKQGTLPHRFRKWVTSEVLPSIRKTGKYENPQYKPQVAELFTDDDLRRLTHLVWSMANGFRFEKAWTQGIWHALRLVTGVPSPQHFEVRQIPVLAEECSRIYSMTTQLKQTIFEAERQAIKRVLRQQEDANLVLGEMQRMIEDSSQQHSSVMSQALTKWQQANVSQFLQRH